LPEEHPKPEDMDALDDLAAMRDPTSPQSAVWRFMRLVRSGERALAIEQWTTNWEDTPRLEEWLNRLEATSPSDIALGSQRRIVGPDREHVVAIRAATNFEYVPAFRNRKGILFEMVFRDGGWRIERVRGGDGVLEEE
jgi:hypothetical protein